MTRVVELPLTNTLANSDIVLVVTDPSGAQLTRTTTIGQLLSLYGGGGGGGFTNGQSISVADLVITGALVANGSNGTAGQLLTSNGTSIYWSTVSGVNVAAQYVWSNTQTFSNTITFSQVINGTANNANNLGGVSLSTIQSQITGNAATAYSNAVSNAAALYQTTAGLSANIAVLTSNNSTNFGGLTLATVQGQITGNAATAYTNAVSNAAALYQTTAGLSANVLILTSNAAGFLGNSSGTLANIASWVTGNAATAYTNATTFASNASNITTGTLPDARLSSAIVNTSGNFTVAGNIYFTSANNLFSTIRVSGNATINAIVANGSTGTANQILTSNGSGIYWSAPSSSGASSIRQTFTANATVNTTFTIVGGYSPGYIDVYKNGVKLINGTDVTVTSGSVVVLATAAPSNTVIDVVAFNAGTLSAGAYSYSSYISQQFTANGTGNTFTISGGYIPSAIEVFVGGVKQVPGSDVTVTSGSTVNFTTAPLNGQIVDVFGYQGVGSLISGATYVRQTFTANSTVNTSFTITGGYTVNYIDVYKNGVKLINGTEVTATNGSTVVLAAAALSNDIVDVVGYNSVSLAAINTTAQYTWSNTLSFTANLSVSNASLLVGSNVVVNATSHFVGNSTVNTNITAAAISMNGNSVYPSTGGFRRNRIINGAMQVDQRNSGSAQTFTAGAALAYSVDRWYGYCTGANVTGQRVAGSGTTQYRYQFTGAASVTAIGFAQRIETSNSYDLNNSTAILSVDLSNSLLTTVTWTAYYANTADTFGSLASPTRTQIATGTFTVTSTLANYTMPISIPAAATTGIEIVFTVGAQTSGTWVIGNVQLESGSVATPFERLPIGEMLMLCQRYYEQYGPGYRVNVTTGANTGTTQTLGPIRWRVPKRVAPTISFAGTWRTLGQVQGGATTLSFVDSTTEGALAQGAGSGYSQGQANMIQSDDTATGVIYVSAEL